jgi:hypothetical protein
MGELDEMKNLTVRGTIDADIAAIDALIEVANAVGRESNTEIDARIRDFDGARKWLEASPGTARKMDSAALYRVVMTRSLVELIRLRGGVRRPLSPEQERELDELSDVVTKAGEDAVESRSMAKRIAAMKKK